MNAKKFIKIYEREIKQHREEYYKDIINNSNQITNTYPLITFLVPLLITLLIIVLAEFSINAYIISIITLFILNTIIYFVYTSKIHKNEYLSAIKRYGYSSIDDYEKKLKKYISGPDGYYNTLLLDTIEKYNINSSTKRIKTIHNEEYYIWSNHNKDKIYLLNTQSNQKPEPKILPISCIRYFRVDQISQHVILKTDNDLYEFKPETITLFNELIKNKRLENLKSFEPGTYINDFEIYMHKVKKNLEKDYTTKKEKFDTSIHNTIYLIIAIALVIAISTIIDELTNIANIINIILILLLNISINGIINNIIKVNIKSDIDTIRELNNNPEYIHIFKELKYVLGINDNYDKVYTKEGAEYITWMANGYFHIFLNMIYYNSVYMAVKASNVKYYKVNKHTCDVKLKDKTLEFTKEAQQVFSKLLPNKDYDWIKSYQNK